MTKSQSAAYRAGKGEKCNVLGRGAGKHIQHRSVKNNQRLPWLQLREQGESSWEGAKVQPYHLDRKSLECFILKDRAWLPW